MLTLTRATLKARVKGFTIVELIVVVVIIAILAAIAIVAYNGISRSVDEAAVKSNLRMALAKLMNDNTLSGAYPASLAAADEGRGIAASGKTTFEYTYTAVGNAYCLTARSGNSAVAPYHISNTESSPQSGACTGHSVTGNLVINGRGENGNNTNFSVLTYDSADSPPGATGSFAANTGAYLMICNDQRISVDPAKRYKLTGWARQRTAGATAGWYLGLCPLDASGNPIGPEMYMFRPGTTTTLAQPLNPGDTVVYLTNISASWYDSTLAYMRSFIFWGYTDPQGVLWPPETYTRNSWRSDIYNGGVGAINRTTNTITLNKAWPGEAYPAGHPVSNGAAGATYMYSAASNATLPNSWQQWTSPTITGTVTPGLNSATTSFPPATKSVKILTGINSQSPPATSRPGVGGIQFDEIQ